MDREDRSSPRSNLPNLRVPAQRCTGFTAFGLEIWRISAIRLRDLRVLAFPDSRFAESRPSGSEIYRICRVARFCARLRGLNLSSCRCRRASPRSADTPRSPRPTRLDDSLSHKSLGRHCLRSLFVTGSVTPLRWFAPPVSPHRGATVRCTYG